MIDILYAQGGGSGSGSPFGVFLPFVLVILIFYFLLIRPQAKRQKALERKRESMRKGDVFITSGGLYAKVTHFKNDGKVVVAELSKGVRVEVVRSTIMEVLGEVSSEESSKDTSARSQEKTGAKRGSSGSSNQKKSKK